MPSRTEQQADPLETAYKRFDKTMGAFGTLYKGIGDTIAQGKLNQEALDRIHDTYAGIVAKSVSVDPEKAVDKAAIMSFLDIDRRELGQHLEAWYRAHKKVEQGNPLFDDGVVQARNKVKEVFLQLGARAEVATRGKDAYTHVKKRLENETDPVARENLEESQPFGILRAFNQAGFFDPERNRLRLAPSGRLEDRLGQAA